jgi:hypothetical protein
MVWGRRDHFCDIRFLSVHMRLAPAATSGPRFCGELVGARKNARHSNFRYRWFRVRSQSLPSLGAFGGLVLVRQARQSGTFSFVAPSLQSLHQVCKVCTKSAKSASGTLNAHFVISLWKQMHTLCRLCKHFVKTLSMHTRCRLTAHFDFRTMCRLIAHFLVVFIL